MKENFQPARDVWGPIVAIQLQYYPAVFESLLRAGAQPFTGREWGRLPRPASTAGIAPEKLSRDGVFLKLLDKKPENYAEQAGYFDEIAEDYQSAVGKYKQLLLDAAWQVFKPYLSTTSRVLDASSGPGYETVFLAGKVPHGEVVAADLSENMIRLAFRNLRTNNITNAVCFQADIGEMPAILHERFDLAFCSLSFHYFSRPLAVTRGLLEALKPGGVLAILEPVVSGATDMISPLLKLASPCFRGFWRAEELAGLFQDEGSGAVYWQELIPGAGILLVQKA